MNQISVVPANFVPLLSGLSRLRQGTVASASGLRISDNRQVD